MQLEQLSPYDGGVLMCLTTKYQLCKTPSTITLNQFSAGHFDIAAKQLHKDDTIKYTVNQRFAPTHDFFTFDTEPKFALLLIVEKRRAVCP